MKISLDSYISFIESANKSDYTVDFINQILYSHGFKKIYKTQKKVLVEAVESMRMMNTSRVTLRQNISSGPFESHDRANLDVKSLEWFECSNCCVTSVHTYNIPDETLASTDLVLYEGKKDEPVLSNSKSTSKRPAIHSSPAKKKKRAAGRNRPDDQYSSASGTEIRKLGSLISGLNYHETAETRFSSTSSARKAFRTEIIRA